MSKSSTLSRGSPWKPYSLRRLSPFYLGVVGFSIHFEVSEVDLEVQAMVEKATVITTATSLCYMLTHARILIYVSPSWTPARHKTLTSMSKEPYTHSA